MLDNRHDEPGRRLRGNSDMDAAAPMDDTRIVVEQRIEVRLIGYGPHHGPHQEWKQGKLGPVRPLLLLRVARNSPVQ